MADVWLCPHHIARAQAWLEEQPWFQIRVNAVQAVRDARKGSPAKRAAAIDARERLVAEREHSVRKLEGIVLIRELESAIALNARRVSRIYYLRRLSDGLIKIGTSLDLAARVSGLRGKHGHLQLLLTHDGSYQREHRLHDQFADIRVTGEWFRPEPPLLEWMIARRRDPDAELLPGTMPLDELLELAAQNPRIKSRREDVGESGDA